MTKQDTYHAIGLLITLALWLVIIGTIVAFAARGAYLMTFGH